MERITKQRPADERVNVLGVGVDPLTVAELHARILDIVREREHALVLHQNVHGLNLCYHDPELRAFFNAAPVVFCDGAGVVLGARILGARLPKRITYADWAWQLAAFAEEEGLSVFLLGARPGVAEKAAGHLLIKHPGLKVAGVHHGYFDQASESPENEAVLREINAARPDILLVGFGMPLQERWLARNWDHINASVALTGGAVFDYVSGELERGPRILTDNGFEWLARLFIEPRRLWRRYVIGNPLFLVRVLKQRLNREMRAHRRS
ncbi:MAG: N-acetylmannosaminyltransferase [uncultured Rubrobacteraceae bacterium]|uniref:N-acetylmannosaminyltransferase n=1 Tax=uncultured Rubrobacteraceae bacterium TaxID=349277 RepID=A0A6J4QGF8_9ACTN|nr:MAG: N-acetylmannosaminyltransferase [uncultured Rubrobacteraceae bacterium]